MCFVPSLLRRSGPFGIRQRATIEETGLHSTRLPIAVQQFAFPRDLSSNSGFVCSLSGSEPAIHVWNTCSYVECLQDHMRRASRRCRGPGLLHGCRHVHDQ